MEIPNQSSLATEVLRYLSRNLCLLHLLLNSFEFHLGLFSVYSVSLWLNDLFQGSLA